MNGIAKAKETELLAYLCNGLENLPDTPAARYKQMQGIEVFKKVAAHQTVRNMQDNDYHGILNNSFSRCRSRFDEYPRILLTSRERK